jgi:hypothetical protein
MPLLALNLFSSARQCAVITVLFATARLVHRSEGRYATLRAFLITKRSDTALRDLPFLVDPEHPYQLGGRDCTNESLYEDRCRIKSLCGCVLLVWPL